MEIGRVLVIFIMLNWLSGISCSTQKKYDKMENTFGSDLEFLKKHKDVIVLKEGNAAIAVIGDYQGRVMTSTSNGKEGNSYGWINYDLIASGKHHPHINAYGGEDRFWMGPEGGQYAIFFEK